MATTAQTIIRRSNLILQDVDNVRWSQAELIGWLNEGQLMVVNLQPAAYSKHITVDLDPGTKQELPSDSIRLLDVVRNQDGIYDTAIRVVARIDLDTQVPNWHKHKPSHIVQHYMYDPMSQDIFYVYPPQPDTVHPNFEMGKIEIIIAATPPLIMKVEDNISLKDVYIPALVDYVIFRAYAKDSESSANRDLKQMYEQQFYRALGMQGEANNGGPAS